MSSFAKNKKIVIIGAGLAGLTAAYRLQQAGMEAHVYEARSRVGGRVFTVQIGSMISELGAQNICDGGDAVHIKKLISEFNLELIKTQVSLNHAYFNGADLISVQELLRSKKFNPQMLRSQIDALIPKARNLKDILLGIVDEDDPLYKAMAVRLAAYEGGPIEKLSTHYAETLFHMLLGGVCSAHPGVENHVNFICIKGGNALLPEKIAEKISPRIHLNKPLAHVAKDRNGLFHLTFQDNQTVKADILILTVPCSVYEKIVFEENVIATDRLHAIKSVPYGTNAKILVPFDHSPPIRKGILNDQILGFLDAQSLLTLYATGNASHFCPRTIINAYTKCRPMMEMGFKNACPAFMNPVCAEDRAFAAYKTPVGYSWPNDPYAKGSYSYISAEQEAQFTAVIEEKGEKVRTLFAPIEQKLFFAGEHASILDEVPGTMEAACESGERVARLIVLN